MEINWRERISIKPDVYHGKPCIRGTRIWISLILDLLASGDSIEEIIREYPQLSKADIMACMAYGAETVRERFIPIAMES